VFFVIPAVILDSASLSFHVPIIGLSAEYAAAPTKHMTNVVNIDIAFTFASYLNS
jgi:hypothetical protein